MLLIHYFGFVDPGAERAAQLAAEAGVTVIEDEAHALLTDLVGGACGRLGGACIASLHKLLPVSGGGGALINAAGREQFGGLAGVAGTPSPFESDLAAIAAARRRNAAELVALLEPLAGRVDVLRAPAESEVPQTLPVIIREANRDELYERMNAAGFGVVSLYHTLIEQIPRDEFPESFELSRTILNLPVHHQADAGSLAALVAELDRLT